VRIPHSRTGDFVPYAGTSEALARRLGTSGCEIEGILREGAPKGAKIHENSVIGRVVGTALATTIGPATG